jgi:hypothetical protein
MSNQCLWRRARPILAGLFALVLAWQLFASTQHHHDLSRHQDNCPSCELNLHFSGGTHASIPAMPLLVLMLISFIAHFPVPTRVVIASAWHQPWCRAPPC